MVKCLHTLPRECCGNNDRNDDPHDGMITKRVVFQVFVNASDPFLFAGARAGGKSKEDRAPAASTQQRPTVKRDAVRQTGYCRTTASAKVTRCLGKIEMTSGGAYVSRYEYLVAHHRELRSVIDGSHGTHRTPVQNQLIALRLSR